MVPQRACFSEVMGLWCVSTKVPMLSNGGVDTCGVREWPLHDRFDESVLLDNTKWLAGYGDELLLQSLS